MSPWKVRLASADTPNEAEEATRVINTAIGMLTERWAQLKPGPDSEKRRAIHDTMAELRLLEERHHELIAARETGE